MSWVQCACGGRVSDTVYPNPAKACFVKHVDFEAAWDRTWAACEEYVNAVASGRAEEWLRKRMSAEYVALGLSHGQILSDLAQDRFRAFELEILECHQCGRLLIETQSNHFEFYSPDTGKVGSVFETSAVKEPEG